VRARQYKDPRPDPRPCRVRRTGYTRTESVRLVSNRQISACGKSTGKWCREKRTESKSKSPDVGASRL
jgi:hypothetical protein